MKCPQCGSKNIEYKGVDDGYGDFGDRLCDVFMCNVCGEEFEKNCVDEGYECVMCGKSAARKPGMRCPTCEQVWNS